ncbi:methyltransferase domain-containing protein [Nodularia spumigena]|uniref:Magnesium-protoporphyrin O-methyltransferase n=1 Tax=Nodularia spumigena UHCC 0039 TaxID=1914872 RepID=A0A2S0Q6S5_NODSP|nr:methyltransferase domain-containing protein [Nodularia spumigena]AVZ30405.1 magnesium-protoporphyrin O-methyltransferase [Nodularia spumigena UHCC 0039]
MVNIASDLLEIMRQRFDSSPYPRQPLEKSPKNETDKLYIHSLVNAYYLRNQKVIDTQGKLILDAGCGSGYKSLMLAEANPGAKIVGFDISPESVKLARERLDYHGFDNAEFHVLALEELPSLNQQFDYINCDELLYLLPDINVGLKAMQAVLKPEGIIRTNLHSIFGRSNFFSGQKIFTMMGLMAGNPGELEVEIVRETIQALKNDVELKARTWQPSYATPKGEEIILMNYLLQGDKGYTIPDIFSALAESHLEFISMVNWRQWQLLDLFQEPDNLPTFLAMSLPDISPEESLHLYELFNPVHRLLDFCCGHPQASLDILPVTEWTADHWRGATVHLCPQLKTPQFPATLIASVREVRPFPISQFLSLVEGLVTIDSSTASCLIPLLEQPQPMMALVERWRQFSPLDPVTLQPLELQTAFEIVQNLVAKLASLGYLMLERA